MILFMKQKTAYELHSSNWSSDGCSSDLVAKCHPLRRKVRPPTVANCDPNNLVSNNLGNITNNISAIFDDLWAIYPKKVGKGQARKAFNAALRKVDQDKIQHSLSLFVRSWGQQDKKFMPHLATWLNGERWDDEIQQPSLQDMTSDQQMQAILGSLATDRKMIQ